jgi:pimeloyl-ACP methyl ester carboxylesterase
MVPGIRTLIRHLSLLAAPIALAPAILVLAQAPDNAGSSTFTVLLRGARVGSQTITLARTGSGWLISSTGRLNAPFDLTTTKFEMAYAPDWQAQRLNIEAAIGGQPIALTTTFGLTTATNELTQSGRQATNLQQVSPRAVVLPDNFYAAYEALAARLASATPGTHLPVYLAPEAEANATVNRVTSRRIVTPDGPIAIRDFSLTLAGPAGLIPIEIWTDERQRLVRLVLPTTSVVVLRDDLASVMTREEPVKNPGDQTVFIPSNGFSLAGTFTKPVGVSKAPAVIFASGPNAPGRDHVTYGVPIVGQLAGRLANAGYFVVRYDSRGIGQSGGRTESASLVEYTDDVLNVIAWLRRRDDVDADRIAVLAYGESGPIALLAAGRQDRIKAVGLLAVPGRPGHQIVLEQQERLLARVPISATDRSSRIALQSRVNEATVTGKGWEGIPANVRRQAETPWFKSWLLFDPEDALDDVDQPILIVHGALDAEIPRENADDLEQLARKSRRVPATHTKKIIVPALNHLLVPATSGEVDEYATLETRVVSPAVGQALNDWLGSVLAR